MSKKETWQRIVKYLKKTDDLIQSLDTDFELLAPDAKYEWVTSLIKTIEPVAENYITQRINKSYIKDEIVEILSQNGNKEGLRFNQILRETTVRNNTLRKYIRELLTDGAIVKVDRVYRMPNGQTKATEEDLEINRDLSFPSDEEPETETPEVNVDTETEEIVNIENDLTNVDPEDGSFVSHQKIDVPEEYREKLEEFKKNGNERVKEAVNTELNGDGKDNETWEQFKQNHDNCTVSGKKLYKLFRQKKNCPKCDKF